MTVAGDMTRHVTRPAPVYPAQTSCPGTFTGDQLRNPGERPSAGAQLCALEEADGWRYQLFAVRREVALVQVR